jgi:hypothetical protein
MDRGKKEKRKKYYFEEPHFLPYSIFHIECIIRTSRFEG